MINVIGVTLLMRCYHTQFNYLSGSRTLNSCKGTNSTKILIINIIALTLLMWSVAELDFLNQDVDIFELGCLHVTNTLIQSLLV